MDLSILRPDALALVAAVALDLAVGDPVYSWHPVRLMGRTLTFFENRLRSMGLDGYGGGILLFLILAAFWTLLCAALMAGISGLSRPAGFIAHVLLVYSLLAMRDLLHHALAVDRAARRGDLRGAHEAVSRLVGRDTDRMDLAACRRAAIESMAENLTDGFLSPLLWYAFAGIPGIVLFKVVSTMDSMVGYKNERYLRFGWCGARLDDVMNFLPARLSWIVIALTALLIPGCSCGKAWLVGWRQHAIVPGPNSGWSEAAVAGAIQRRLIGPIWSRGQLVADVWLGCAGDPEAGDASDVRRAAAVVLASGLLVTAGLALFAAL